MEVNMARVSTGTALLHAQVARVVAILIDCDLVS